YIHSVSSVLLEGHVMLYRFFFQAEDGIRYSSVTGVQTCALPISTCGTPLHRNSTAHARPFSMMTRVACALVRIARLGRRRASCRSEERRVGKECRCRM